MSQRIHTRVDQKFFMGKAVIVHNYQASEGYVYRIKFEEKQYILKGFEVKLSRLEAGVDHSKLVFTQESFMEVPTALEEIFQEYYFAKFASSISPHFPIPKIIDYAIEITQCVGTFSYLYVEMIFDYGGQSLDNYCPMNIERAYNLMRQSATALSTLHLTKTTHLDIKPQNMVLNINEVNSQEILQIIDMGSAYKSNATSLNRPTQDLSGKLTSYTQRYSPPEVIKAAENLPLNDSVKVIGKIDVYCWAMSFYQLLTGESDFTLCKEVDLYKKRSSEEYTGFINLFKQKMSTKIDPKGIADEKKKEFIEEKLLKALSYDARKRPDMSELIKDMKKFERKEGV